jgi:hypothetical protein
VSTSLAFSAGSPFSLFPCLGIKVIENVLHEAEKFLHQRRIFTVERTDYDGTERPCIYPALSRRREPHSCQQDGNTQSQSSHGRLALKTTLETTSSARL